MKRDQKMELAVYTMLEHEPLSPEKSMLFESELAAMVARKIVKRLPDGGHDLVNRAPAPAPAAAAKRESMITLTFRAPSAFRDMLDRKGPSRSEALRSIIEKAMSGAELEETGTRRKR